jgi:beta-mannosidase
MLIFTGYASAVLSAGAQIFYPEWQIGYHRTETVQPDKWYPSVVPGAVQLDVMKAENYKQPWWYADNVHQFDWMEEVWFTYRTTFEHPKLKTGERLFFHSKGIDYRFKIILNDVTVWEQEGMFTYVEVDLTDRLQARNELRIVLYPVPTLGIKVNPDNPDQYRQNARESVKPAVSYGWDWHPRCVTRGIWDETYLITHPPVRLSDVAVSYTLNDDLTQAHLKADVTGMQLSGKTYRWTLTSPNGKTVLEKQGQFSSDTSTVEADLESPSLWWPNGYGNPDLYTSAFVLMNNNRESDRRTSRIGFRRIRLVMNEGAWKEPQPFPLTRAVAPSGLEVNNRRIFGKGSNWVHPEVFIGTITAERYREQLILAKNAYFNIVRVWGGGIVNKESFFDICDETGILVWQEFPLACNNYPDKPEYLRTLEQEAASIVKRLKRHACLAIWSGGNELFNSWGGMTEQSYALRLLNSICYRLDPQTPFIYTSPFYGVGHGHYLFYDPAIDREVFQWMMEAHRTAYTEFGVPALSNTDALKRFIPAADLFPPRENSAWKTHHAYGAWRKSSWLEWDTYCKYFGEPESLDELVRNSQLLQSEGYKFIFEEARRQKPYCSMAINWCYQEPWPAAANNSLICWPNEPKPAYYDVAGSLRPTMASLRIPKFTWSEGEELTCDLFLLNDAYEPVAPVLLTVVLKHDGKETELLKWECKGAEPFRNVQGPTVHFRLPHMKSKQFTVQVKAESKTEYESEYTLLRPYAGV